MLMASTRSLRVAMPSQRLSALAHLRTARADGIAGQWQHTGSREAGDWRWPFRMACCGAAATRSPVARISRCLLSRPARGGRASRAVLQPCYCLAQVHTSISTTRMPVQPLLAIYSHRVSRKTHPRLQSAILECVILAASSLCSLERLETCTRCTTSRLLPGTRHTASLMDLSWK